MSTLSVSAETATRRVSCAHCGLPAPAASDPTLPSFCCRGCQGAYQLIRGWGLEEYYELRDGPAAESRVDEAEASRYADLDDASLLGRSAPLPVESQNDERLLRSRLAISGLHCVACVWLIERASEQIDGWHSSTVNMSARTLDVLFDPAKVQLSEIAETLHRIGYRVSPMLEPGADAGGLDDQQRMLVDIAVAAFCAANAMWIAVALYAGQYSGIATAHEQVLRVAGVLLGLLAVIFPGRVFFRSAWASLRTHTPHMDLPVAVGLTTGLVASLHALFDSTREVYFDSIACLVLFLLVGRWLQMRQQRRAGDAVGELLRLMPMVATRVDDDGQSHRVRVDSLTVGDVIEVGVGESVPIDGVVLDGESSVDRSLLTGESVPQTVRPGSLVEAGTDNLQTNLKVRATAAAADTRFAALSDAVAEAAQSRTPVVQLANRIGGWFVIIVLALAALTAVIWSIRDPSRATGNVVALLIVACPCALALATPLAIAVAIGRLARRHVLVREGDCLERVGQPGTIFFDKTGTLTEGRMRVTDWFGDPTTLSAVAAIEAGINHPIARAICELADQRDVGRPHAENVNQSANRGVAGCVGGVRYVVGGARLIDERGVQVESEWNHQIEAIRDSGVSPIVVVGDGELVAVFGVRDPIRSDAAGLVQRYQRLGWRTGILSGDDRTTVLQVAGVLEIAPSDAWGELLPTEKLQIIEQAKAHGMVMMVGDGVNDAAALAAADVGVAISGGAAASLQAAPVIIGDGEIGSVSLLADAAVRTRRGIRHNFAMSISYNVVAVGLAMSGMINPLVAALLMPISSLSVLGLTLARPTLGTDYR